MSIQHKLHKLQLLWELQSFFDSRRNRRETSSRILSIYFQVISAEDVSQSSGEIHLVSP